MSWTDERVETLKKLWTEGLSASQIASRLGGVSRNAVIGKVHRLGLSGRATTTRNKPSRPRPRVGAAKRTSKPRFPAQAGNIALRSLYQNVEPYQPAPEDLDIPCEERVKLVELTECSCRWPIGDPQTSEFGFCNRPAVEGLTYCETHARRAFQPPQSRSRRSTEQPAVQPAEPQTALPEQKAETPAPADKSDDTVDA